MDQDSFRRLLQTPRPSGSAKSSRGFLLANAASTKPKTIDSSETAFKPRKLKKADSKYRDRAAERRVGEGNDYAHVEAIYEEFERKTAASENTDEVEVQRRYLGGDGEHSILVKGLDHSLLEQNKARAALSTGDDDALEEAFMEGTSHTPINVPKKRTREELLRDLKEQRARNAEQAPKTADEEARLLEEAKQKGRFKPIGFKPIGPTSEGKKKKEKRSAGDVERKNKKRKVENLADKASSKDNTLMPPPPVPTEVQAKPKLLETEEPIDDDFNIFADAGEYEGINVGEDDDDDDDVPRVARETEEKDKSSSSMAPQRWIPSNEAEPPHTKPSIPPLLDVSTQSPPSSHKVVNEDEAEDEQPMRLVPLSSSAVPSIKDFLAMDQAAGSYDKKKRKNKKKTGTGDDSDNDQGQKQKSVQSKVDRDYKRLKSYTDKKAAAGSK